MNIKIFDTTRTILQETEKQAKFLSTSYEIASFIQEYKKTGNTDSMMYEVIKKISEDGYDIKGFCLYERPEKNIYVFYNETKNEMFNVYVQKNESGYVTEIGYFDIDDEPCTALNIKTAIRNYNELYLQ